MKNNLISVLRIIGRIIGFFFSLKAMHKAKRFSNFIYSGMIIKSFRQVGTNFLLEYPSIIYGAEYITVGDNFSSFQRLRIDAIDEHNGMKYTPHIIIGNNVSLNFDCHIASINEIIIGNNVLIASRVFISDHSHGFLNSKESHIPPSYRNLYSKGPVIIEDDVWIGEGVTILPNVRVGKGTVIGANAVVTKSFPPYSVLAGIPATLIKTLCQ